MQLSCEMVLDLSVLVEPASFSSGPNYQLLPSNQEVTSPVWEPI